MSGWELKGHASARGATSAKDDLVAVRVTNSGWHNAGVPEMRAALAAQWQLTEAQAGRLTLWSLNLDLEDAVPSDLSKLMPNSPLLQVVGPEREPGAHVEQEDPSGFF